MKIYDVEMQCQLDSRYSSLIMTFPEWQLEPDTIGTFGCKITAFLNAFNLYNKNKCYMTLSQLNKKMIENNGYLYLNALKKYDILDNFFKKPSPEMVNKARSLCMGAESNSIDKVLFKILGIESCVRNYCGEIDIKSEKDYFIVKTEYMSTGHFSLIIKKDKSFIDSALNKIILPDLSDIIEIRKITFLV